MNLEFDDKTEDEWQAYNAWLESFGCSYEDVYYHEYDEKDYVYATIDKLPHLNPEEPFQRLRVDEDGTEWFAIPVPKRFQGL